MTYYINIFDEIFYQYYYSISSSQNIWEDVQNFLPNDLANANLPLPDGIYMVVLSSKIITDINQSDIDDLPIQVLKNNNSYSPV